MESHGNLIPIEFTSFEVHFETIINFSMFEKINHLGYQKIFSPQLLLLLFC